LIEFDQLETFTKKQFFYMLSRNRSTCGVDPYIRATCNPEPGWLAEFLSWWIDDDGWAIPERSGVIRWLVRQRSEHYWGDSRKEMVNRFPGSSPKSVTFILSTVYDNQYLLDKNPAYLANLQALDEVDKMRLLGDANRGGNWHIRPESGKVFNRDWFEVVDAVPAGGKELRFWDLAATSKKTADSTASCKGKIVDDIVYILDATNDQISPAKTDTTMKNTASQDGTSVAVRWEQEGGASGKRDSYHIATMLAGYDAHGVIPQGDKITRAKPLASQALAGNVKILRGKWNERWLEAMHLQDGRPTTHDDDMDAASGMYSELLHLKSGWVRTPG
jgi:predicted phage terminase large subunit-like protein